MFDDANFDMWTFKSWDDKNFNNVFDRFKVNPEDRDALKGFLKEYDQLGDASTKFQQYMAKNNQGTSAFSKGLKTAGTALKSFGAALGSMAINWMLSEIVGYLFTIEQRAEEARQKTIEIGEEASKTNKELGTLVEQYRKLGEDGSLDNSEREKAYGIEQQINDLLGDEINNINLQNGSYEEQLKLLRDIQHQKANDNYGSIKDAKDAADKSLRKSAGVGTTWATNTFSINGGAATTDKEAKEIRKMLLDTGFGNGQDAFVAIGDTSENLIKAYEDMISLRNTLSKSYTDEISKGGDLHDFYNELVGKIEDMSEAVQKYKDALANYNINEAIIQFNETDFSLEDAEGNVQKFRGSLIDSEDAMSGWIEAMLDAKDVSDGVQSELIALAKVHYPQYITQINAAIQTEARKVAQDMLVDKSISDNIRSLDSESKALGLTRLEMLSLITAEINFNKNNLDVSQKVAALKEVAVTAGIAQAKINGMFSVTGKSSMKDKEAWAKANGVKILYNADKDGTHLYEYKGQTYTGVGAAQGGITQYEIDSMLKNVSTKSASKTSSGGGFKSTGGGSKGSSSSSSKNSALDNYLKDAENRYKIHQDETKYINDLNYALQNLVKTKEEELDVTGKINEAYRDLADNRIKDLEHQIDLKKELYGEDYDATAEWTEIQRVAHDEADRYREFARKELGYYDEGTTDAQKAEIDAMIEKTDEIQDNQKAWWDAENSKLDFYSKQHENLIRDIEHARDMALEANPFTDTTSYYKQMQEAYHKEAERLRELDPEKYKEEIQALSLAWWDAQNAVADWSYTNSQNWITLRNTYNDWDKYGDNEAKAWKRVLDRFKKEFPDELDKIREIEENYYNAIKDEVNEILDLNKSRIESQKTLLQSYYDVSNSVAEAQHEINKEFAASLTMSEYLDERTRDLLFNQKDYNILSDKLVDIQAEADKLQRKYNQDILGATADNLDEITSKYQMQYDIMMKQYEIAKAELEVAKKRQQLDNVLNERNVRMFINGQWQWVANTQDVIDAQNELADAKFEAQQALVHKEQTESMNELTSATDKFTTIMNEIDSGAIDLRDGIGDITSSLNKVSDESVPALENVLDETKTALRNFASGLGSSKGSSGSNDSYTSSSSGASSSKPKANATATIPGLGTVGVHVDSSGKTTTSGLPSGTVVHTGGGDYKITGGSGGKYTSVKVKNKYASGSGNTKTGDTLIGEKEPEIYIDNNGHLIPVLQPTVFKDIEAGGKVFNGLQMRNLESLWNLSNVGFNHSLPAMVERTQAISTTDNSIHIGGITIPEQGNEDWINGLRRYVYTHKGSM